MSPVAHRCVGELDRARRRDKYGLLHVAEIAVLRHCALEAEYHVRHDLGSLAAREPRLVPAEPDAVPHRREHALDLEAESLLPAKTRLREIVRGGAGADRSDGRFHALECDLE